MVFLNEELLIKLSILTYQIKKTNEKEIFI